MKFQGLFGVLLLGLSVSQLSYHYSTRFLDWLRFQSLGTRDYIVDKLAQMFMEVSPERVLAGLFALSFGLGSLVFLLFLPQLLPGLTFGLLAGFLGWKAPKPLVNFLYQRRVTQFVDQMVDALGLMSNGLKSGLSISQSLALVVQEMENPIRQEFNLVLNENKLGVSLEESFTHLSERIVSEDVEMFVTAINILKETGGNLAETFDTIVETIRERVKVQNKIESLTQGIFFQGMFICLIPPMLGLMFHLTDPEFISPLYTTPLGWLVILIILGLESFGFFVILRIIKIEV